MQCAQCATPVPDTARYCHHCGSLVSDAEGQAAATSALDDSAVRHMERLLRDDTQGEFEILHQIGRGGMAAVYLAREVHLDRHVAIKVLPPELTFGHGVERFKREARTAAALDHPNIIPIYRIASGGKLFWYAMRYLEGRSLDVHIKAKKRLELDETIRLLRHVAGALDYAHHREVVHRDVKPANVMMDNHGRVIVTDFGIAKPLTESTLTASGSLVGTPYYMSPEQGMGKPVSGASDQYSVAVMAFHMLTGRVPFEGDSAIEVLHKHCTVPAPAMDSLRPGLPTHVYFAVKKALAKKAEQRFESVMTFVEALERPSPEMAVAAATADTPTQVIPQARPTEPMAPTAEPSPPTPVTEGPPAAPMPTPPTQDPVATTPIPQAASSGADAVTVRTTPVAHPSPPVQAPESRRKGKVIVATLGVLLVVAGGLFAARSFFGSGGSGFDTDPAQQAELTPAPGKDVPADASTPEATTPPSPVLATADTTTRDTAAGERASPSDTPVTEPPAVAERTEPQRTAPPQTPSATQPRAAPAPPPVASIAVRANATSMTEGESQTLSALVRDARGRTLSDRAVRWASSNAAIVSVTSAGAARARAPGRAYVVAVSEERRDSVLLTVNARLVRVAITQRDTTLQTGATVQLGAQALGTRGPLPERDFAWTSSNPGVVNVDNNGRATARAPGSARIIARKAELADTLTVTVAAPPPPEKAPDKPAPVAPAIPAEEQISGLVTVYVQRLRARDMQTIDGLYPVVDQVDRRKHRELMTFLADRDRAAEPDGPRNIQARVSDDTAMARFGVTFRYRNNFGATNTRDVTFIAEFTRAGAEWRLVSCRLDPRSGL